MATKAAYDNLATLFIKEEIAKGDGTNPRYIQNIPANYTSKIQALQAVIKKLRDDDLSKGYCFMIFDDSLPEGQAYYEYPDGCIRIEQLDKNNIKIPRVVVKVLNKTETAAVRKKHAIIE